MDDDTNKGVFFDGKWALGYTGLSQIEGVKTDHWLANAMHDAHSNDMQEVLDHVADLASRAFRRMKVPEPWKRHAFSSVGWAQLPPNGHLTPILSTVSNALAQGGVWLDVPNANFSVSSQILNVREKKFVAASAGLTLSAAQRRLVQRNLERIARRTENPVPMLRGLMDAIRLVAEKSHSVGHGLLAICIPRKAVEKQIRSGGYMLMTGGNPSDDYPTFAHVPADSTQLVKVGPQIADADGTMLDFTFEPHVPDK